MLFCLFLVSVLSIDAYFECFVYEMRNRLRYIMYNNLKIKHFIFMILCKNGFSIYNNGENVK